jgi:beta-lactamase regulating signal transducer with metallopeptidase domain
MTAIADAISAALLHFLWQGLLAAILLFTALSVLRTAPARVRYGLSCIALAAMILSPVITAFAVYRAPAAPSLGGATGDLFNSSGTGGVPTPAAFSLWIAAVQAWTLPIWFAGVFAFAFRLVWSYKDIARLRREGSPAAQSLIDTVHRLARRMKVDRPVSVLISERIDAPGVVGWLRPAILMPAATLLNLGPDQLQAILAHELAHIRRHDYLINLLQALAETLFFYQPAIWWVSSQIRLERELCCDDVAVEVCGDAVAYARALTKLERLRVASSELALSSTAGPLLHRIRRLSGASDEQPPSRWPAILALCFAVVCLMTSLNWAHAQPQAGSEATVRKDAIWVDTVKYGDLPILVRSLGTVKTSETVELQVPTEVSNMVELGQAATIELRRGITMAGKVAQKHMGAANGTINVVIALRAAVPEFVNEPVDAIIHVKTLNDVAYVGRPTGVQPDGEASLFKIESDRNAAKRVKVRFGAASVTSVQVLEGLQAGDRVILSDMSKYAGVESIRLE